MFSVFVDDVNSLELKQRGLSNPVEWAVVC